MNINKGFTLIELIIVIIIVGILATVGLNQYTAIIERGRAGEARSNLAVMRKLANEYYLKNGTLVGMTNADVGMGSGQGSIPSSCVTSSYFYYYIVDYYAASGYVGMRGRRCESGGKPPNAVVDSGYLIQADYYPGTGSVSWGCVRIVGGAWDGACSY